MRPDNNEDMPVRPKAPTGLWLDYETDEFEFGTLINAVENPEILSASSVDRLNAEKMKVEAAEISTSRIMEILNYINTKEGDDALVSTIPGDYPETLTGCCGFF